MATVMRTGPFFVWRSLPVVGLGDQQEPRGTKMAALPNRTMVSLGQEFHADLKWRERGLGVPYVVDAI